MSQFQAVRICSNICHQHNFTAEDWSLAVIHGVITVLMSRCLSEFTLTRTPYSRFPCDKSSLTRLHPRPPSKDMKRSGYILRLVLATPEKEQKCNITLCDMLHKNIAALCVLHTWPYILHIHIHFVIPYPITGLFRST